MPTPDEVCNVTAGGTNYIYWKEVEVERSLGELVSEARLVVAEVGDLTGGWATLKLKPGDQATVTLAGQLAATGKVYVRQVAYDGTNHSVRIVVQTQVADLNIGTVDVPPGQFKNQTLPQLSNAVLQGFGINFSIQGSAPNADKIFPRVSVHIGETPIQFITRLCYMRNIHLMDDLKGNLIGIRAPQQVVAELQEGVNILSAEMIWRENSPHGINSVAEQPGTDQVNGDAARSSSATATNPNAHNNATQTPNKRFGFSR